MKIITKQTRSLVAILVIFPTLFLNVFANNTTKKVELISALLRYPATLIEATVSSNKDASEKQVLTAQLLTHLVCGTNEALALYNNYDKNFGYDAGFKYNTLWFFYDAASTLSTIKKLITGSSKENSEALEEEDIEENIEEDDDDDENVESPTEKTAKKLAPIRGLCSLLELLTSISAALNTNPSEYNAYQREVMASLTSCARLANKILAIYQHGERPHAILFVLLLANIATCTKDINGLYRARLMPFFNTLGLDKNATPQEIKRTYRRLSMQHHPDKHMLKGKQEQETANTKMQEINEAYDQLKKNLTF